MYQHNLDVFKHKVEAFGWHCEVIDGHDVDALVKAFDNAAKIKGQPTCILAKTFKGKYFPTIEDSPSWHGKPLGKQSDEVIKAVQALIKHPSEKLGFELLPIKAPTTQVSAPDIKNIKLSKPPSYKLGEEVATRLAYGTGFVEF